MKTLYKNIHVPAVKDSLITESKLFSYIDSDFKNYGANKIGKDTKEMNLDVRELTEDMTFAQMFPNPEQQSLSQGQILNFIEHNQDKLRQDLYSTFFLFKASAQFFVARVGVSAVGLGVSVYRLGRGRGRDFVWRAADARRVVVPQLESESTFEPLSLSSESTETILINILAKSHLTTDIRDVRRHIKDTLLEIWKQK